MKRYYIFAFLSFHLLTFCAGIWPVHTLAQGLPFVRNYPATVYNGHNQNFDVITTADGMVYVANFEGLLYYDNAQWQMIHTSGIARVTSIFRDSRGTIWTGGYNHIGRLTANSNGTLVINSIGGKSPFQGEVRKIWEKDQQVFFLVSDQKTYKVSNGRVVTAHDAPAPVIDDAYLSLIPKARSLTVTHHLELVNGLHVIATKDDGLYLFNSKGTELFHITAKNGLCSNNIARLAYNGFGLLWGVTDNGIFAMAFPSIYTHFTQLEGLTGEVMSIQKLGGKIFVGTYSGLFYLNGKEFQRIDGMKHACWQLEKQGNSLLAATENGVYRIPDNPQLPVTQVTTVATMSLLVDGDNFYSGETDGVYYNTSNKGRTKLSSAEKTVKIMKDKSGAIWLQNLYGRIWHKFQPFIVDNDADELATLVSIDGAVVPVSANATKPFPYPAFSYSDKDDLTWVTDNKSKNLYAFQHGSKQQKMSAFTYPLMDYSVRAMLHDDNLLWMGGDKGINILDYTRQDPLINTTPTLYLRSIVIHGDSVIWGKYLQQVPDSNHTDESIIKLPTLSSKDRNITFYYAIDHPSLLLHTQYRYRLNGDNWSAWDIDTYTKLTNQPYGNHTFEVQARDQFGHITNIAAVKFVISYPFYLRWYMALFYVALIALLVYGIIRLRLRSLQKDKHRLELLVKERTDEVVRLEKVATVAKLTQGLIDRILNPLNYINNFAKLSEGLVGDIEANIEDDKDAMDKENYEDTVDVLQMLRSNLQKVGEHGQNTTRTLKAMEEVLKNRSGGMVPMDLAAVLRQDKEMLYNYYADPIRQYGISISFNDDQHPSLNINGNADQLSKTIMSILANAVYAIVKKAQRISYQPEIAVNLAVEHKTAKLTIRDNGIGIEDTIINKVFDPFFTTKPTSEAAGVGLYLCREVIQNHGGEISVASVKDEYTLLTITLPSL